VGSSLLIGACAGGDKAAAPHPQPSATLPAQYLRIAAPANARLEVDFDRLTGPDLRHLTGSVADLRDAASTERKFDRDLLKMSLPPALEVTAHELVAVNESRANLTSRLSAYDQLAQLTLDEKSMTAANAPVEDAVRSLRHQLGLPPPQTN
jgi:hypothetical protein